MSRGETARINDELKVVGKFSAEIRELVRTRLLSHCFESIHDQWNENNKGHRFQYRVGDFTDSSRINADAEGSENWKATREVVKKRALNGFIRIDDPFS